MQRILNACGPFEIKQLGREVKHFNADLWDSVKSAVVVRGNYLKFT